MNPLHAMECPECAEHVAPMSGSTWAIAWYSCGKCGTFWYARLRVGRDADQPAAPMLTGRNQIAARDPWTLEELEAEVNRVWKEIAGDKVASPV